MNETAVFLSRIQFALTAMYHFLFVPLTIGLVWLIAMMETIHLITKKEIWLKMTKFWGKLFGINFAMGVATGITLEFQFGTNWAYYSHYVGDIFGAVLALEGMMAFFLEATLISLFFFAWNKLTKRAHLLVTWFLALATSMSAFWILIANAWMQNPIGSFFNPKTMRMELHSFYDIVFNPVAQVKFCHTTAAGYVTGAMFVMAISSYYLLNNKQHDIATRSFSLASCFGLFSTLILIIMGDESGYHVFQNQPIKAAALEGVWKTEKAPASLTLIGWPDQIQKTNHFEIKIPYLMGILGTRSLTQEIPGLDDLVLRTKKRIKKGILAFEALQKKDFETLKRYEKDLGHALLLKKAFPTVIGAPDSVIEKVANEAVPSVFGLFWCFRIMVGIGFFLFFLFLANFFCSIKNQFKKGLLKITAISLPLPWIASESGWFVAEHGRQPWVIQDILPTSIGASALDTQSVVITLIGFVVFYSFLAITDIYLMIKEIKKGPED